MSRCSFMAHDKKPCKHLPVVTGKLSTYFCEASLGVFGSMCLIQHKPVPLDTNNWVILGHGCPAFFAVLQVAPLLSNDLVGDQDHVIVWQVLGITAALETMVHQHFEATIGLVCQLSSPLTHETHRAYHQCCPTLQHNVLMTRASQFRVLMKLLDNLQRCCCKAWQSRVQATR